MSKKIEKIEKTRTITFNNEQEDFSELSHFSGDIIYNYGQYSGEIIFQVKNNLTNFR